MKQYILTPCIKVVAKLPGQMPTDVIKDEPMFYRASLDFAFKHGGPLTRAALQALPPEGGDWLLDSKVHMLMAGHYPAMPQWHCDAVPRTLMTQETPQPNLDMLDEHVHHYAITVSDSEDLCCTKFVTEPVDIWIDESSSAGKVWEQVHDQVEARNPEVESAKDGEMVRFSMATVHAATASLRYGWRWFFRASPGVNPVNEIRKQSLVYVRQGQGW